MSPAPTTAPAVKAKLLELFKTATESDKTEVWPTRMSEEHQTAENVYVGGARGRRAFRTFMGGSPGSREEDYSVGVEVEVSREGTSAEDVEANEARMWEIAQALEFAVASRPTLEGLANVSWAIGEEFEQLPTATYVDGVKSTYVFGVKVTARI